MTLSLRQKLGLLADEIEEQHHYNLLRGRCSCGTVAGHTPHEIKNHYLDAVAEQLTEIGVDLVSVGVPGSPQVDYVPDV